jgi:hypothetical protein
LKEKEKSMEIEEQTMEPPISSEMKAKWGW